MAWESASASTNNEALRLDTEPDGVGDGAVLGAGLCEQWQPFTFNMGSGSIGNSLDIRIRVHADFSDEEIAFDNIMVSGTFAPETMRRL